MSGTKAIENKVNNWREKAKNRRKENAALKKRIKELGESRSNWKAKYQDEKAKNKQLEKQIKNAKGESKRKEKGELRAKHHQYSVQIMLMCIWIYQQGNVSLRSCVAMLKVMVLVLGLEIKVPSRNTIRNWNTKLGYWRIHQKSVREIKWALILDESISIGQQKLLLVLGVDLETYRFGKSLNFEDVKVLYIGIGKSWTAQEVSRQIENLQLRTYSILYGISDGGTNLCKALKLSKLLRIADCTHVFGNLLKNQYKKQEEFLAFCTECGKMRKELIIGKNSLIIPPKQRVKGKFLNLQNLAEWAHKMLVLLDGNETKLSDEMKQKLAWLTNYRSFIKQLYEQCTTMNKMLKILKTEGLSSISAKTCVRVLEKSSSSEEFKKGVRQYLDENLEINFEKEAVICCSDIIESYFGKYKNKLGNAACQTITASCLGIANFNQSYDLLEIKKAMEKVKMVDLKQWNIQNRPSKLNQQKKELFKSVA